MKSFRLALGGLLLFGATGDIGWAQGNDESRPQNSASSEQRNEKETHERLEQLACGTSDVHFSHHTRKEAEALPGQPPDRGLVYVIRPASNALGLAEGAKLAVNGKWVGVNRRGNYFYMELDPGPHYFCAEVSWWRGLLSLEIEKGKTYYLKQEITLTGIDLELIDKEKGQKYLAKCHRSIFEEKAKNH